MYVLSMYVIFIELHCHFQDFVMLLSKLTRGTHDERVECVYRLYDPRNDGHIEFTQV